MADRRATGLVPDPIVDIVDCRADYDQRYGPETQGSYVLHIRQRNVLDLVDQPGGTALSVEGGPLPESNGTAAGFNVKARKI